MWFFGQQCLLKPSIYVLDPNLQLLYSMNICGSTSNTTASILCRKISVFSWLQWVADYQFPEVRSWDASLSPVPSEVSHHQFDFVPCLGMWFQPTIKLKWFVTVVITARGVIHLCHIYLPSFRKIRLARVNKLAGADKCAQWLDQYSRMKIHRRSKGKFPHFPLVGLKNKYCKSCLKIVYLWWLLGACQI